MKDWHHGKKVVEVKKGKEEHFLGPKGLIPDYCQVQ